MNSKHTPSKAATPDLDWSQIRETVLMLNVAVTQIERAMREGDDSINTLAEHVTSIAGKSEIINKAAQTLPSGKERTNIINNCHAISEKMQEIIIAFQFYDKLTQRLSHVNNSLAELAKLISEEIRLFNPYEWHGLQQMIKSKYTIESDKAMFDAILDGASVQEAMKISLEYDKKESKEDDVELF